MYFSMDASSACQGARPAAIEFRYDQEWLSWESTFPISLSLPLREDPYIGVPVINVFDNLLPDCEPIRRRVAERIGALQFLPDGIDPAPAVTVTHPAPASASFPEWNVRTPL
jgi:HipA-like protein